MSLTTYIIAILCIAQCFASGGPDPNPLTDCLHQTATYSREKRIQHKSTVQAILSLSAQLGLARLRSASNRSSIAELESWLSSNQSRISDVNVAMRCLAHRRSAQTYHGRPTFSILLEYFKRPWAIRRMASTLRDACLGARLPCELVVNVDNPHEAAEWAAVADEMDGFVVPVFSANVHEARGYNRAARAARGSYLIIWQDDQIAPANSTWLLDLLRLFQAWPRLAVVGMNTYRLCRHTEPTNRFFQTPWDPDPRTGVRWSFVQYVDFAPLVVRSRAFAAVGGLDEGVSRRGDCGIWSDWELCNRVWLDGWQVGYLYLDGRSGDGHQGGTHTLANAEKCWGRQQAVASACFDKRFGPMMWQDELCGKVWSLNLEAFGLSDPANCPYGSQATKFGNCTRPR